MNIKFIIYAYRYDINSGGTIVLHFLCHLLNTMGYQAYLWSNYKPIFDSKKPFKSIGQFLKYYRKELHRPFVLNHNWNTSLAKKDDLKDAIVIYPEIVDGNPLRVNNVVRWLLHKPGFHSGKVNFDNNDLIMGYGERFSTEQFTIDKNNLLVISYVMTDIYKQTNFGEREGSCHMIRKGTNKKIIHENDSVCVDGLSHEDLAKIFNEKKYFISYDPYTYYSIYASLCGCISVIVPDDGVTKEQWQPKEEDRYGLSYGISDINYAIETRGLMLENIKIQENENIKSVKNFIELCRKHFNL